MNKSESIKELANALSKAQGEMTAAKMTSENPFYKSKYADLGEVITAARQPLTKNGLSFSQHVLSGDGNIGVETILMHNSGEWISSEFHLPLGEEKGGKSLAQSAGSIITYLRRYTLSAILGVYADEDTDGESKSGKKPEAQGKTQTQTTPPTQPSDEAIAMKLVELKIVENAYHARGALKSLECEGLSEEDAIKRVRIYRAWRDHDPKMSKDDCKAKAIAGELPA